MRDETLTGSLCFDSPVTKKRNQGREQISVQGSLHRQEKIQAGKEVSMNSTGFIMALQRGRVLKGNGHI